MMPKNNKVINNKTPQQQQHTIVVFGVFRNLCVLLVTICMFFPLSVLVILLACHLRVCVVVVVVVVVGGVVIVVVAVVFC